VDGRARVLIVEDDEKLRKLLARVLGEEHTVTALASGREALARIEAGEQFDLI
jgi:CheY-like chemotaxis protein